MAMLPIGMIRQDGGTQPRTVIDLGMVEEYGQAMAAGDVFPPVTVFYDGTDHWLADGFHRIKAAAGIGLVEIEADVRQGTRRDAVLFSVGANAAHGLRRTNEDKRRSVLTLLNDVAPACSGGHVCGDLEPRLRCWATWSDREIARRCGVSPQTVVNLRPKHTVQNGQYQARTFVHPKTRMETAMRTENIGRRPPQDGPVFGNTPSGRDDGSWSKSDIPAASATAPTVPPEPKFDHEAAALALKLDRIVIGLSEMPSPMAAVSACMQSLGYGTPVATVEAVAAWLNQFLDLYREAEPTRLARVNAAVERTLNVAAE